MAKRVTLPNDEIIGLHLLLELVIGYMEDDDAKKFSQLVHHLYKVQHLKAFKKTLEPFAKQISKESQEKADLELKEHLARIKSYE